MKKISDIVYSILFAFGCILALIYYNSNQQPKFYIDNDLKTLYNPTFSKYSCEFGIVYIRGLSSTLLVNSNGEPKQCFFKK